jgi:type VII secretion integral membrane protein EccD
MTAARVDASPADAHRGGRTDLCRLTILADHTQVDLAVPFGVPLALIIPGIVDMIESHSIANDFDTPAEPFEPTEWVLARIGQSPLSATLSLGEHGVRDGDLLVLQSAPTSAPAPLFDDIMHNVAALEADRYRRWTPLAARVMGSAVAVLATVAGAGALLLARAESDSLVGAFAALFVAALLITAGTVVSRIYLDRAAAAVLCGCAMPLAFTAGALMVPGRLGAPGLLLGIVTCGAAAALALRISGVGLSLFTGIAAAALPVSAAAAVGTLTEQPTYAIGAVLAAVALVGLAAAPRIAMLLAKLPLPPVPAPGSAVDIEEEALEPDAALPSFASLALRAARARQYLTGLVCAMTGLTAVGALVAARVFADGGVYWPGTILASVCAGVLMLRGRTYASAEQAAPLIGGGAAIVLMLLVGATVTNPGQSVGVFALAVVVAGLALTLGIIAPNQTFSPVLRRCVELLDYAAIAAVVPLVCWVSGLFTMMRGL